MTQLITFLKVAQLWNPIAVYIFLFGLCKHNCSISVHIHHLHKSSIGVR